MKLKADARRCLLAVALILPCLVGTGCESICDSLFDSLDHGHEVHEYREQGFSERTAERKVYEDQFFDHMNND